MPKWKKGKEITKEKNAINEKAKAETPQQLKATSTAKQSETATAISQTNLINMENSSKEK